MGNVLNVEKVLLEKRLSQKDEPKNIGIETKEEENPEFRCRLCGCKKFSSHYKGNDIFGPGGRSRIIYYSCDNCSVMFMNPKKFSK